MINTTNKNEQLLLKFYKILTQHWASPSHSTTSQTQRAQSEAPRMPWMQSNQLAVLSQHCDQAAEENTDYRIDSPLSSSDKTIILTINLCKSLVGTFFTQPLALSL